MGFLRIHCNYCGGAWEVYGRDDWKNDRARTCPHCFSKIEKRDWKDHILPAFGVMLDANRELVRTHTGYHSPLFTIDYLEDAYFPDAKAETEAVINNLQASMDELHETMESLAETVLFTRKIEKEEE